MAHQRIFRQAPFQQNRRQSEEGCDDCFEFDALGEDRSEQCTEYSLHHEADENPDADVLKVGPHQRRERFEQDRQQRDGIGKDDRSAELHSISTIQS